MNNSIKLLALCVALGGSGAATAASWSGVYYELTSANSLAGNAAIGPAWESSATGGLVQTTQLLGNSSMNGIAAPGVLKAGVWNAVSVAAQAGIGVSDYATSHAVAAFNDQLSLMPSNSALIGQTVTVNARFLLSGDMLSLYHVEGNNSAYFDVYASTRLQVSGTGITGFVSARDIQGNSGGSLTSIKDDVPTSIPISFNAVLGLPTSIQYNLDLQGQASASFGFRECGGGYGPCNGLASAELVADYMHSLLWDGISSVTDVSGNPIDLASALGDSGFDYLTPAAVPVPAALGLFGSGLLGMLAAVRRQSARLAS